MEAWLEARIKQGQPFSGAALDYVLGRGGKPKTIEGLDLSNWLETPDEAPSEDFKAKYGPTGERLEGSFMIPLRSPKGKLLGVQFQKPDSRFMLRHLFPEADWHPIFFGLPKAMAAIWSGAEVWLGEGFFDLTALEWVMPPGHVVLGCLTAKLSDNQAAFLQRFASKVHLVFDEDKIGRGASYKALRKLQELEVTARQVKYSGGKDPGAIWDNFGEAGLFEAFKGALPVV